MTPPCFMRGPAAGSSSEPFRIRTLNRQAGGLAGGSAANEPERLWPAKGHPAASLSTAFGWFVLRLVRRIVFSLLAANAFVVSEAPLGTVPFIGANGFCPTTLPQRHSPTAPPAQPQPWFLRFAGWRSPQVGSGGNFTRLPNGKPFRSPFSCASEKTV